MATPPAIPAAPAGADEGGIPPHARSLVLQRMFGPSVARPQIDRYRLRAILGRGAQGVVYEAYDPQLARTVALKLLTTGGPRDARWQERARQEARTLAALDHPNIVEIYDFGFEDSRLAAEDGPRPYVVMEYIEGVALRQWIADEHPPVNAIVGAFAAAAEALHAAHGAGIVHRDFKPDNVLRTTHGRICIVDFGLAHAEGGTEGSATLEEDTSRSTRSVAGTPWYMAPEQHHGEAATPRADQFALCVSLYEMLTSASPFAEVPPDGLRGLDALAAAKSAGVSPPRRGMPRRVHRAICRGLSADPHDRFADLEALVGALRGPSRRPARWGLGAASAAVAMLALGGPDPEPCDLPRSLSSPGEFALPPPVRDELASGARRWRDAVATVCGPTDLDAAAREASIRCLDRFSRAHGRLLEAWVDEGPPAADTAIQSLRTFEDPGACLSAATSDRPDLPLDEQTRLQVEQVRQRLRLSGRWERLGQYRAALGLVRDLEDEAEAIGDPPLQAEVALGRGTLLEQTGDYPAASEAFETAWRRGWASRHDAVATEAAIHRVGLAYGEGNAELARYWGNNARSSLARLGPSEGLSGLLEYSLGTVEEREGNLAAARAHYEVALEHFGDRPERVVVLNGLGNVALHQGSASTSDEALAYYRRGREAAVASYGEEHPKVAALEIGLASAAMAAGDLDEATRYATAAQRRLTRLGPDGTTMDDTVRLLLGEIAVQRGQPEGARRER